MSVKSIGMTRNKLVGLLAAAGLAAAACGGTSTTIVREVPAVPKTSPAARPAPSPSPSPTQLPAEPSSPAQQQPAQTPAQQPEYFYQYGSDGTLDNLEQSVALQQEDALASAPASEFDYTGPGTADVTATVSSGRMGTYTVSASDQAGDTGTDTITVSQDGSSWSDTGMTWSGPSVTDPSGFYTTPAVSGWNAT